MTNRYEVSQPEKNCFLFQKPTLQQEQEVEVFLMKTMNDTEPISVIKTNEASFTLTIDVDYRPYFLIKTEEESYVIGERTLPVEGMNNFRDMGGYPTVDGKHVKWGKLYRSDHIHNATAKGLEYLQKLGIHTIIDYRSDVEIEKYPNPTINDQVVTYHVDPAAHAAELAAQFQASKENEDANLINEIIEQQKNGTLVNQADVVLEQYRTFANKKESKEAFAKMLREVAKPEAAAIVQHCRGGKDRTGYGAMLVLGVLGVPKEELLADYLLTAKNREERNAVKMAGYRKLTDDPSVLDHLYSFIDTKSEFIEASIDAIIDNYNSIENYVKQELGISQEIIDTMKELYLEE
ncbi:tyrosine-protein phosphatase [Enterococcus saccharolyticus]|uniref:Protein-tyrosine-phosphatase n=1 Tax=Candidatus Enterococcus willemsii TaxID=1857215 RepID=A0ABQ6Z0H1_9ENTE|nr:MULTISPECIES: tyrosine-protein phosphatase [Enterococcus]KAF1304525.1 protein-tyrosine-phosphatase [Enterococcus sp. CU12B]MCD5001257.1 tyrosine-protein phosphatase [Enterococcus saccharolyticus]